MSTHSNVIPIYLTEEENRPVISLVSFVEDSLWQFEVDPTVADRWIRVQKEFEECQEEMGKMVRESYAPKSPTL